MTLVASHPMSSAILYASDKYEYIHCLPEYLADPCTGHSLERNNSAFQYFLNIKHPELQGITFYQWLELPVSSLYSLLPDLLKEFYIRATVIRER